MTQRHKKNSDITAPLLLLILGIAFFVVSAYWSSGKEGVFSILQSLGVQAGIQIILGIIACYILASFFNMNFGHLPVAILKLASAIIFPTAVGLLVLGFIPSYPVIAQIVTLILYLVCLGWYFDLLAYQAVILALVIFGLQVGIVFALSTAKVTVS